MDIRQGVPGWVGGLLSGRGIAGLLLLGDEYVRRATIPLAHADLVHVAIAGSELMRDPRIVRIGGLLVHSDSPIVGGATRAFVLVGRRDDGVLVRTNLPAAKLLPMLPGPM